MDLTVLTSALLKRALQALRQAQPPPDEILQLTLLDDPRDPSPFAREQKLHELLVEIITQTLIFYRRAEGLTNPAASPARDTQRAEIELDFRYGNPELEAWSALYHRYVTPLHFTTEDLAASAHVEGHTLTRRLNQGLDYLTAELRRRELAACQSQRAVGQHLPLPEYAQLFGAQSNVEDLFARLRALDGPHFVSIEGMGGIGKTALARHVAAMMLSQAHWEDVLWVSARQEYFNGGAWVSVAPLHTLDDIVVHLAQQIGLPANRPAADQLRVLKHLFTSTPYLVVIDNLETVAELDALLPTLYPLANPTRFLLTSREALAARVPYVHATRMTELSEADSCALVLGELTRLDRHDITISPSEFAAQLYAVVGGNPLALKLATAQTNKLPGEVILADLQRPTDATQAWKMYRHIYNRTWGLLTRTEQDLLFTLLDIDPQGEDLPFILKESGLSTIEFETALHDLLTYSLLEIHSWKNDPRYRLHRLTVTFLRTDILKQWTP